MSDSRKYPDLRFQCPAPPTIAADQRQTWCEHCERNVHNLTAMSAEEQAALLRKQPEACVAYRTALPVAIVLAMGLSAYPAQAQAQKLALDQSVELTTVTVGGAARIRDPLFSESELAEPSYGNSSASAVAEPTESGPD